MSKYKFTRLLLSLSGILFLLISLIWLGRAGPSAAQTARSTPVTDTPSPSVSATPKSTSTITSSGPSLTITWSAEPLCENQPQNLEVWFDYARQLVVDPEVSADLANFIRQVGTHDSAFQNMSIEDLLARLGTPETADETNIILRELAILWLNILSGRLNEATGLDLPDQPEIETVGDLVAALDQALVEGELSASLLEATQQLQTGQNISQHVCSRLVYRAGSALRESLWTQAGYIEHETRLAGVPNGITSFSPDYTKLIIETAGRDTGGGPLYLFDLKTGQLLNLNEQLGLRTFMGPRGLAVAGWHPNSDQLLLFDQNDHAVIWFDVQTGEHQRLDLNSSPETFSPIRQVILAPDGGSFIYTLDAPDNHTDINRYDLDSGEITPLTTLEVGRGQLKSFRFSPTGDRAAYLVKHGRRQQGISYTLELLNLTTYTETILVEGNLGPTEPIWSPDGRKIAFVRKTLDEPDISGEGQNQPWQGNIWVAWPDTGEVKQITFIEGAAYRPIWSIDSRYLAFLTHNGELGFVAVDQPGTIWRMGTTITLPQFTSIDFAP